MIIHPEAIKILQILNKRTNDAFVVGGCVRDMLLNQEPNDWDITTNVHPQLVMSIFSSEGYKTVPTGLKYGTVTVISPTTNEKFEITTFRCDGDYSDNRRPDTVKFSNELKDDLNRRDFTMNALAANKEGEITDLFGGLLDIENKILRCVGNPQLRFEEDALRLLRAIRFAITLQFTIQNDTARAMSNNLELLREISIERIQAEFNKILLHNKYKMCPDLPLKTLWQWGFMDYIIPELNDAFNCEQDNPFHIFNVGEHICKSVFEITPELHLRLAMLFHDIGKPATKTVDAQGVGHFYGHAEWSAKLAGDILRRMRYDNKTIDKVIALILNHDKEIGLNKKNVRKYMSSLGEDAFRDLLTVKEADILAQNPIFYGDRHMHYEMLKNIADEIIKDEECISKDDLAINGKDLINEFGLKQGKLIGEIIDYVLDAVVQNPYINTKTELFEIVKNKYIINA